MEEDDECDEGVGGLLLQRLRLLQRRREVEEQQGRQPEHEVEVPVPPLFAFAVIKSLT